MAKLNFYNNLTLILGLSMDVQDTECEFVEVPLGVEAPFRLSAVSSEGEVLEIVEVTGLVGNIATLTRGLEGTFARVHYGGALFECRLTSGSLDNIRDNASNTDQFGGELPDYYATSEDLTQTQTSLTSHVGSGGSSHASATEVEDGFLLSTDKAKLNLMSPPVLLETEPTEGLVDGLFWYNPATGQAQAYFDGQFRNVGGGITYVKKNTVTLDLESNTLAIGIIDYNHQRDTIFTFVNSTFIELDVDYTTDGTNITKVSGTWESGTVFNFVILGNIEGNPEVMGIAQLREVYTATTNGETTIPFTTPYVPDRDILQVFHKNLQLDIDVNYIINITNDGIELVDFVLDTDEYIVFIVWKRVKTSLDHISKAELDQALQDEITAKAEQVDLTAHETAENPHSDSASQADFDAHLAESANKADKSYVDTSITASQRVIIDYDGSLTELNADEFADETKNYLILDEADTTNYGYVCYYDIDTTSFIKGWQFQSTGVGDESISPRKLMSAIRNVIMTYEEQPYNLILDKHYRRIEGYAVEYSFAGYHSAIIDVQYDEIYSVSTSIGTSSKQTGIIFVDDTLQILGYDLVGGILATHEDVEAIVPQNATKMILSVYGTTFPIVLKKATFKDIEKDQQWYGKTAIFLGDSITSESFNNDKPHRYPKVICDYFGMTELNYGISSSVIAVDEGDPTSQDPMVVRYANMDDGDLVIVAGGTNDWYYSKTPLGSMSDRTNYTFYGALHNLCLGLKKKYIGKTILFMTPIMRRQGSYQTPESTNDNGKTLKEYGDIIKEVCAYYSIPVLDMYAESGLYPFDDDLAIAYYTQQGEDPSYYTHPNDDGQYMMAKRLLGYLISFF